MSVADGGAATVVLDKCEEKAKAAFLCKRDECTEQGKCLSACVLIAVGLWIKFSLLQGSKRLIFFLPLLFFS